MITRIRCAIYTRKSTEDGLEQEFNSLQAQREACEAYIRSQRGVGWVPLTAPYDDGGLSGGTLDRPALQALLGDIAERKVDLVVVYKVDRLTRSLADFAKIVEVFDGHGVSFVSVTQQFNTTTSMGRLTLNMLLSFAQFEREVTGERIRDKIAASKKKGMWMGGLPPLGYDVQERKLVVNETEAETVRQLFDLYLKHGNVRSLKREADRLGLVTKRRNRDGTVTGGKPFSRGNLYQLLHNVLYVGEIAHRGETFPGQHDPIIDRETWDAAQNVLSGNAPARRSDTNAGDGHLLKGRVFDEAGDPLCPTHAVKKGRRYRYYVSKRLLHTPDRDGDGWRLPAGELEQVVRDSVRTFLQDEVRLIDALSSAGSESRSTGRFIEGAAMLSAELNCDDPAGTGKLDRLVRRVAIGPDALLIEISESILRQLVLGGDGDKASAADFMLHIRVAASFRRRGVETRLVVRSLDYSAPDEKLIALVARSTQWIEQLSTGGVGSIREIARRDGLDESDVSRFLPLAFLAPNIVEAIVEGKHPTELTSEVLRHACPVPYSWEAQREVLGFRD